VTVRSGEPAPSGVYVNLRRLDVRIVSGDEPRLTGLPGVDYRRLPLAAVIVLGPVFGGTFAMSLPFIVLLAFGQATLEYVRSFRVCESGEPARWGVYLGINRPAWVHLVADGDRLPGSSGTLYVRIPSFFVVILSPIWGFVYVAGLPVVLAVAMLTVIMQFILQIMTGWRPSSPAWPFVRSARADLAAREADDGGLR